MTTESGGEGLKTYDTEINGVSTTLRLSDRDARARGLLKGGDPAEGDPAGEAQAVELKPYKVERNGIETTVQLSDADAEKQGLKAAPKSKQATAPANKAKTASDKRAAVSSKSFGQAGSKDNA